jgi:GNAT superfamily N-acetyltransferase
VDRGARGDRAGFRRQGLADRLLAAVVDRGRSAGDGGRWRAHRQRPGARAYEKAGFRVIEGARPEFEAAYNCPGCLRRTIKRRPGAKWPRISHRRSGCAAWPTPSAGRT